MPFIFQRIECPVVRDPEGSSDPERELVEGQWIVYLLECHDNSLYCGSTDNPKRRLRDHDNGIAAIWTKMRRPLQLVYYEIYDSLLEARRREKQIKGWTYSKKVNLIGGKWKKK